MEKDFNNSQLNWEQLPNYENLVLQPISRKYLSVMLLNTAIFSVIILVVSIVAFRLWNEDFGKYQLFYYILLSVFLIFIFLVRYQSFFQRKYGIREYDIVYQKGWLLKTIEVFPYKRIQHVELEEGVISKFYQLYSINLYTAGDSELTIHGLSKEEATKIKNLILFKIKDEDVGN